MRAFDKRAADRLLHMDEVEQEQLDGVSERARAGAAPAAAGEQLYGRAGGGRAVVRQACSGGGRRRYGRRPRPGACGRVHVVDSNKETVRLGVFDATLPPILTIDSGDIDQLSEHLVAFPERVASPACRSSRLAELRTSNPGRGPHSIIGPIAVKDAEPGDVLEVRYKRLHPANWGAVFNNPASLGTGLLPQDFSQGQIKYVDLDLRRCRASSRPTSIFR